MRNNKVIHVAIAIIINCEQQILLARRQAHQSHSGKWEFPGGKVELGETVGQALQREIKEELALTVITSAPFCEITHHYETETVILSVQQVTAYDGQAIGNEGQLIQWYPIARLHTLTFPAANKEIIYQLQTRLVEIRNHDTREHHSY